MPTNDDRQRETDWLRVGALAGLAVAAVAIIAARGGGSPAVAEVFADAPFSLFAALLTFDALILINVAVSLYARRRRTSGVSLVPSQQRHDALQVALSSRWRLAGQVIGDLSSGLLEEPLRLGLAYAAALAVGGQSGHQPPPWTLLFATAAWAYLGHADYRPVYLAVVFCMGLALSGSYLLTGTLLVPIVAHSAFNLFGTVSAARRRVSNPLPAPPAGAEGTS